MVLDVTDFNATIQSYIPSPELQAELDACVPTYDPNDPSQGGEFRRLTESSSQIKNMWDLLVIEFTVPMTAIALVFVLCLGWILALQKWAVTIAWATVGFACAIPIILGSMIMYSARNVPDFDMTIVYYWWGFGVLLYLIAAWKRESVTTAGKHLKVAAMALEENWSVFVYNTLLQILLIGFIVFDFYVMAAMAHTQEVDTLFCTLKPVDQSNTSKLLGFMTIWVFFWINSAKLLVTAMSVSSWYFNQERPANHALHGFITSFTTSGGTIAFGAVINAIAEQLNKLSKKKCWFLNPFDCVMKILACFLKSILEVFGKYAMIAHALTGKPLCPSGKDAFKVLKDNLGGAYVQDRVGTVVVKIAAYAFALIVGFASWGYTDLIMGWETISGMKNLGGEGAFWLVVAIYLIFTYKPVPFIIILAIIASIQTYVFDNFKSNVMSGEINAPLIGMFCAATASIVFNFQGDVILYALNTITFSYAVGKGEGLVKIEGREEMYEVLGEIADEMADEKTTIPAVQGVPVV